MKTTIYYFNEKYLYHLFCSENEKKRLRDNLTCTLRGQINNNNINSIINK